MTEQEGVASVEFLCDIAKIDEEQRLVFGWFSVIEKDGKPVEDLDGDIIAPAELEKAAYDFVLEARVGGESHARPVGRLVESVVLTKEKQDLLGIDIGQVGWFGGFRIDDDDAWAAVKSGKLAAFSIGGSGVRTAL